MNNTHRPPRTELTRIKSDDLSFDLSRRTWLQASGLGLAAAALGSNSAHRPSRLGLVTYCCRYRRQQLRKMNPRDELFAPARFVKHCQSLGAGGSQLSLGNLSPAQARALRTQCEQAGLFLEAIIRVPRDKPDTERFERDVRTAVQAGCAAARTTIIPGRRYEYFESLSKFREFERRGRQALERAAPVVEKHKLPLAVENHKDHRNQERVALFQKISSEFVGACVDTGNSIALLEDPLETAQALAPWAHSVHLKDQALKPYRDGFLLADIPLGQGSLELKKIVTLLRAKKPNINFSLELISRDPLKVPVLTKEYWRTFPDLPAERLSATLRKARDQAQDDLQYLSKMTLAEQVAREDRNVRESLDYARQHLGL